MSVFWLWREIDLKMRTRFYKKILLGYFLWSASRCVYFIRPNILLLCIFLFCIIHLYRADSQVEIQILLGFFILEKQLASQDMFLIRSKLSIRAPLGVRAYPWIVSKKVSFCLSVILTGKDGVYALYSVLTFYATKSLKIMEAVVPQSLPICVSPTGKDGVYA